MAYIATAPTDAGERSGRQPCRTSDPRLRTSLPDQKGDDINDDLENRAGADSKCERRPVILNGRMKMAVTGQDDQGHIVYNFSLLALAKRYRFQPRACRPYRAKTKGKVERPFRNISIGQDLVRVEAIAAGSPHPLIIP